MIAIKPEVKEEEWVHVTTPVKQEVKEEEMAGAATAAGSSHSPRSILETVDSPPPGSFTDFAAHTPHLCRCEPCTAWGDEDDRTEKQREACHALYHAVFHSLERPLMTFTQKHKGKELWRLSNGLIEWCCTKGGIFDARPELLRSLLKLRRLFPENFVVCDGGRRRTVAQLLQLDEEFEVRAREQIEARADPNNQMLPLEYPVMLFGEHSGKELQRLPEVYIRWMASEPGFFEGLQEKERLLMSLRRLGRIQRVTNSQREVVTLPPLPL